MVFTALRPVHDWPDIDDRLVEPETRYEMHDGELVHVSPAKRPHAELHLQLAALIEAHTGLAFDAAADLLTRTSRIDDFAPDVSVYPHTPGPGPHGETGPQLPQLAFEIVSTQSLGDAARKAAKLTARGIRRVFAIDVDRSRVLEWSAAAGAWRELDPTGHIDDPALEVPLPIEAMIPAAKADDAVARALVARKNPVIEAIRAQDRATAEIEGEIKGQIKGKIKGKIEALLAILAARGIALDPGERQRILAEGDPARLDRWIGRAAIATTVAAVFGGE